MAMALWRTRAHHPHRGRPRAGGLRHARRGRSTSSPSPRLASTWLEGHFPAGSMGPKMEAACRFVERGGSRTLITNVFTLKEALAGTTGTWVTA